jgi:hypothetical protein
VTYKIRSAGGPLIMGLRERAELRVISGDLDWVLGLEFFGGIFGEGV